MRSFIAEPEEFVQSWIQPWFPVVDQNYPGVGGNSRGRGSPPSQDLDEIMHEFGIAYDIFKTAQTAAQDHRARQVKKVCVDIGEMSMVNPDQVEFLFVTLTDDDPVLKGAVLESRVIAPETKCACGYHGSEKFVCPLCGALPELVRGREIMVTHIEIEVDEA